MLKGDCRDVGQLPVPGLFFDGGHNFWQVTAVQITLLGRPAVCSGRYVPTFRRNFPPT